MKDERQKHGFGSSARPSNHIPDNQQRQYTFFPFSSSSMVATLGLSKSICKEKKHQHRLLLSLLDAIGRKDAGTTKNRSPDDTLTIKLILPSPSFFSYSAAKRVWTRAEGATVVKAAT